MKAYTGFESNGYDADSSGFADLEIGKKGDDAHQNVFKGGLILKNHKGKGVVGIANDDHPPFELTLGKSFEGGTHPIDQLAYIVLALPAPSAKFSAL